MTDSHPSGTPATGASRATGRHPVDIGHRVMGIAFAGLVAVWALYEGGVVRGTDLNWFLPLPWIAAGAAGLAALAVAGRRRARRDAGTYPTPYASPDTNPYAEPYTDPYTSPDTPEENR